MGVFEALGEPARRLILELLAGEELPVGEIVARLRASAPMSQPAVSQHLKVLLRAKLVTVRAEGTRRFYAVDPDGITAAQAWLSSIVDPIGPLAQPLDALATEVARGKLARSSKQRSAGYDRDGDADDRGAAGPDEVAG